jgi:hypothetical protein
MGLGMLVLSYLPFFLERKYPGNSFIVTLPLAFYLTWLLIIYKRHAGNFSIVSQNNLTSN